MIDKFLAPLYWGVNTKQTVDLQRQITLMNVINLVGLIMQVTFFIVLNVHGYLDQAWWNLAASVFHLISLVVQYLGYFKLAQHIFAITFPAFIVALTFVFRGDNSTEFYIYLCFPLIFFLFKEKWTFRLYSFYLTCQLILLYWARHHGWISPEAFAWEDELWYINLTVSFLSFVFLSWTIQSESTLYEEGQKNKQEAMANLLQEVKSADTIKGRFLKIFSHDLRAPFHGILGVIDLLLEEKNPMTLEEAKPLLKRLHESSKSTLLLLDNLVDWTKSQQNILQLRPQTLSMHELVEQTITLYEQVAHMKNIELTFDIPPNLTVWADQPTVMTILRNLLNNAIKYSHPGGVVTIRGTKRVHDAEFSVEDQGTGMKSSTLDTLFKEGQDLSIPGTQGEKGSGLGLALCQDFIEKNQGKLIVSTEWGQGTRIQFTLPLPASD